MTKPPSSVSRRLFSKVQSSFVILAAFAFLPGCGSITGHNSLEATTRPESSESLLFRAKKFETQGKDGIAAAAALYRELIEGKERVQTILVPDNGNITSENVSIGRLPFWPQSIDDINYYSAARIEAVLRLCALESSKSECDAGRLQRLADLAKLEGNFTGCRIRAGWGAAGPNPRSFTFGSSADFERQLETRRCIFAESEPEGLSKDQSRSVWYLWLALEAQDECLTDGTCKTEKLTKLLLDRPQIVLPDSLTFFAMRDAAGLTPSMDNEVGDTWWRRNCRMFRINDGPRERATESSICKLIESARPKERE